MAVRVIDEKPDPSVVKHAICKHCGVKLEYLPIDVKSVNGTDYSGGPDGCEFIECPKCNNQVILRSW